MKTLKRLIVSVTFGAMLATMLLATGAAAYAKTGTTGGTTVANGSGSTTTTPTTGGLFEALGVTWE